MSAQEEAAKLAATTGGAFVEVDEHKLDKGQMYLLGAQQTLDALIVEFMEKISDATAPDCPSPYIKWTLEQVVERFTMRRDALAVALTRSAVKSGAAKIHNANGNKLQ